MTEETWEIEAGARRFVVPRLPFRVSRVVYPICQRLTNADMVQRLLGPIMPEDERPTEPLQLTDEEVNDLAKIMLLSCQVADPTLTAEEFDNLPITPSQLYDSFFAVRKACGGWRSRTEGDQEPEGEAQGTEESPT